MGRPNCLGVIELGSHCFLCRICRGNKPCSLTYPCRACKAKILRNQVDVKLGAAKAASAQATSDSSSGGSPPSKRTRSKGPEPTMPDDSQASKPRKLVDYLTTSSSDSVMSVSIEEASPPPVVTVSDSASGPSTSEAAASAGDPSSESSGVESADEAEGGESDATSAYRSSAEAEFNVSDNHAQVRSEVRDNLNAGVQGASANRPSSSPESSPPPYLEREEPPAPRASILKSSKPRPLGAWLTYSDGSVEQFPVDSYKEMRRVAFGIATSAALPEDFQAQELLMSRMDN